MTPIVRNTACLVCCFVMVYGLYVTFTGHVAPGGGFAGAAVIVAGAVLLVLALGLRSRRRDLQRRFQPWTGVGALGFLLMALGGLLKGGWLLNFVPKSSPSEFGHELLSSGTILILDVLVCVMVSTGLVGVFLKLVAAGPVLRQ